MRQPQVLRYQELRTVARGGGVTTKPLVGNWIDAEGFTSGITTLPPGGTMRLHTHNVEESVTVLEGEARCEIEGDSYNLQRFDTTYIPPGIAHRFVNVGNGVMRILWVYATTYVTRTLVETGETVEHLSPNDLPGAK